MLGILGLSTFGAAQSPEFADRILQRTKAIYRDHAPSKITFITLPESELKKMGVFGKVGPSGKNASIDDLQVRANQPGDSATGVVLQEEGNQAVIDASPCNGRAMVFTQPYSKTAAASVECGGQRFDAFRFVQK